MTTKLPSIPGFDGENTLSVLSAIKETLEVRTGVRGDTLDSGVTFRDLESMGYLQARSGGSSIGNLSANVSVILPPGSRSTLYDPAADLTTPPPPTNLTAVVVFDTIMLKWDVAKFANPSYFEIHKSFVNELGSAQIAGTSTSQFFIDVVGEDRVVYYWARTVSAANIRSAWNSSFGTEAKSGINPATLVDKVSKQVLSSDLYKQLSTGITDSYDQTRANVSAITAEAVARGAAISSEATIRQTEDDSLASSITTITAAVGTNAAGISSEATARATADSAVASQVTVLASATGSNTAALQVEQSTRTAENSAAASSVTTLSATVGGHTSAIQQEINTRADQTGDLFAQYSVKIDQNGYVSGFGLSSESVSGVTKSAMMIRADRFAVVNPAVTPISVTAFTNDAAYRQFTLTVGHGLVVGDTVSFFDVAGFSGAHTVGTVASTYIRIHDASLPATATINAASKVAKAHAPFTVQDGNVYIDSAIIKEASIADAKIGSVSAKKINAGFVNVALALNGASVFGAELYAGGSTTTTADGAGNVTAFTATNPTFKVASGNVEIVATNFKIKHLANANDTTTPFEVVGGVVKIKDAQIGDGTITTAKIADTIQSTNYNLATKTGWQITKAGALNLNSATLTAGMIQSTDGKFQIDLTNKTISIEV